MAILLFIVTTGSVCVAELFYVSADLRRTLTRAVSPDAADGSLGVALQRARSELHTRRDRQEFSKLKLALDADTAAKITEKQLGQQLQAARTQLDVELHSQKLMFLTEQAYLLQKRPVPSALTSDIAHEQMLREHAQEEQRRTVESAWLRLLQERLETQVRVQELRTDLGLPRPMQSQ